MRWAGVETICNQLRMLSSRPETRGFWSQRHNPHQLRQELCFLLDMRLGRDIVFQTLQHEEALA